MRRKATSPLIAEIILIFVVVVVAIPLGSFVFGTSGSYAKTADVSISLVTCTAGAQNTTVCAISLDNLGSANAYLKPSAYMLIYYGHSTASSYSNTCQGQTGNEVSPGSTLVVNCAFNVAPGLAGSRFTGWVALESGQNLPFAGSF